MPGRVANRLRWLVSDLIRELCGRLVVALGLHRKLLRGRAVIVAFHSISKARSDGALRCSTKHFDAYCSFFSTHMNVCTLSEVVNALGGQIELDGQLAITFDDGYADNAELALPILEKWKLKATFYVASGFIGSQQQAPWDLKAGVKSQWMSWSQLRQLARAGHDIGVHTVSHADLGALDASGVEREVGECRDTIRAKLSFEPKHLAIPFGRSFPTIGSVIDVAHALGFQSASLCRGGIVTRTSDRFCLERWPINAGYHRSPYSWIVDVLREPAGPPPQGSAS